MVSSSQLAVPASSATLVLISAYQFVLQALLCSGGVPAFDKWETV